MIVHKVFLSLSKFRERKKKRKKKTLETLQNEIYSPKLEKPLKLKCSEELKLKKSRNKLYQLNQKKQLTSVPNLP
jgi:hypothetical protein